MMAGNPTNWWSMIMNGNMHPQLSHDHDQHNSSSNSNSSHFYGAHNPNQDFPRSLSQLLMSGFSGDEEKFGISPFHEAGNSEDQSLNSVHPTSSTTNFRVPVADVKPELAQLYDFHHHHHVHNEFQTSSSLQQKLELDTDHFTRPLIASNWSQQDLSSPASSCITTGLSHNLLNFSNNKGEHKHQHPDHNSTECNSTSSGGISKKARVQQSSAQPSLKVRKEKLGDRVTSLHQLVSPFGKTDTASVLSEAIGYIRFLQAQIQALSSPYLGNASGSMGHIPQQSLNDSQHKAMDLRSRGLCLVPISCMANIGSDTGADYWAPALGGGF
ncbi:transcription factor bHLH68-like isoform X2 [Solanum verrucosum]|uniref:transcription factor bHLH68-like isoform X2 n=1 Tax=Solanum verrucosum TaxID=315347 RepID=UPI0020D1381F|nr:transcription factor bHLH68-like isoform X2 [Solanum verrucosum]